MTITIIVHNLKDKICLFCTYMQLHTWLFKIAGMKDPKDYAVLARRKFDLNSEILAWRIKLQREWYVYTITYYFITVTLQCQDGDY